MTILTSANGSLPLSLRKGETLVIRNYSGIETVANSIASRERAAGQGEGVYVYGPQTSDVTLTLSSTGSLDYQIVSGDVTPLQSVAVEPSASGAPGRIYMSNSRPYRLGGNAGSGAGYKGSMGRQVATWSAFSVAAQGNATLISTDLPPQPDNAPNSVRLIRNASPTSAGECAAALSAYTPVASSIFPSVGVWIKNPGTRVLDFRVRFWNVGGTRSVSYGGSIRPGRGWQFMTLSGRATVAGNWTIGTDQIGSVRVEQTDVGPNGAWVAGDELLFGAVYADVKARPRFMLTFDDVPSNAIRPYPLSASAPASGRSAKQMLDHYGFRGTVYVTSTLVGGTPTNITASEIQSLIDAGWAIGSHSTTHPIDATGAGLRLLGPYGYNRSRASRAGNAAEAGTMLDCRVISATTGTNVLTCENNHSMSVGSKFTFVDTAPTGFQTGVTYYVTAPSGATLKLASTPGNANSGTAIAVPSNWTGLAEWRWPGSAPDDSAICADIKGGIDGLTALGFRGHELFHALPQGGWDHYVRSAVERLGIRHTRGISSTAANHRSIHIGYPTGGSCSSTPFWATGWPEQADAISTDQSFTLPQATDYVDECITFGYTGANYHHSVSDSPDVLDGLLAYLKTKVDAGEIDVVTVWDLFDLVELW